MPFHILEISDIFCSRRRVYSISVNLSLFFIIEGLFTMYSSCLKRLKRQEGFTLMFWRYFAFSVLQGRYSRSVNFPLFSMIQGIFMIYSSGVWNAWRDKRNVLSHSGDITHALFWEEGLSCLSPFFTFSNVEGLFAMYSSVIWIHWRDKRGLHLPSGDILHFLSVEAGTLGQSNSPPFSMIWGVFIIYSSVIWRAWGDERNMLLHFGDITHVLFFGRLSVRHICHFHAKCTSN
jgi:hypothetical protein